MMIALAVSSCDRMPVYKNPPLNRAGDIAINIRTLREGTPEFYSFAMGGKKIDFFLVRTGGDVQSYFDACAMCYPRKLGYRVEDGKIVCRACNVSYTIDELKTGIGSCHPIALPGRSENGSYIITRAAIKGGSKYF